MALGTTITAFETGGHSATCRARGFQNGSAARLDTSAATTSDDYAAALAERAAMRAAHAAIAPLADAIIAPACPGPAPVWNPLANDAADNPRPTATRPATPAPRRWAARR